MAVENRIEHPEGTASGINVSKVVQLLMSWERPRMTVAQLGDVIHASQPTASRRLSSGNWTVHELDLLAAHWDVPVTTFLQDANDVWRHLQGLTFMNPDLRLVEPIVGQLTLDDIPVDSRPTLVGATR